MKKCKKKVEDIRQELDERQKQSYILMDKLGNLELDVMESFDDFADVLEEFKERPDLNKNIFGKKKLPTINTDEFRVLSSSAIEIKLAVKNAADGVVGCVAAGGSVGIALTVLEAVSTGAGGTTGAALLSAITSGSVAQLTISMLNPLLGIGVLVGGAITLVKSFNLSEKVKDAKKEVEDMQEKSNSIIVCLNKLDDLCLQYYEAMREIKGYYDSNFFPVKRAVEEGRNTMAGLSKEEKTKFENSIILADILYKMCKVQFIQQTKTIDGINNVNEKEINNILSVVKITKNRLNIV